jgi:hypothetical protein
MAGRDYSYISEAGTFHNNTTVWRVQHYVAGRIENLMVWDEDDHYVPLEFDNLLDAKDAYDMQADIYGKSNLRLIEVVVESTTKISVLI